MKKVIIKTEKCKRFYNLHFRYTLKSFPKDTTEKKYKNRLMKKLKMPAKYEVYGPEHSKGRGTFSIYNIPEKEADRLCKKAQDINDDILREVKREFNKVERVWCE